MGDKKSKSRIRIVAVLALFLTTFVMINAQQFIVAAVLYIIMGSISLNLYGQWGKIGKIGDLEGIDDNWRKDAFIGFLLAVGTIILGQFVSFIGAIGIPPVQSISGTVGRFIIIVFAASIFEEIFFRDFMLDFFDNKIKISKFWSNVITAIAFSLFHLAAYGDSLSAASGSFLSAALMGFIFGLVSERQNSLAGSITFHAVLNAWLGFFSLAVILSSLPLMTLSFLLIMSLPKLKRGKKYQYNF